MHFPLFLYVTLRHLTSPYYSRLQRDCVTPSMHFLVQLAFLSSGRCAKRAATARHNCKGRKGEIFLQLPETDNFWRAESEDALNLKHGENQVSFFPFPACLYARHVKINFNIWATYIIAQSKKPNHVCG